MPPETRNPVTTTQIINSLDLLRIVITETVSLDSNDRGLCPFCAGGNETAFTLYKKSSKDRARFHCFSCGARGDIFNFIQTTQKTSFQEAKRKVAELISRPVTLPEGAGEGGQLSSQFQGLLDAKDKFCEKDCPKYIALREDYEFILEQSYIKAGVEINPDLETISILVDKIIGIEAQILFLKEKLREAQKPHGGFGSITIKPNQTTM